MLHVLLIGVGMLRTGKQKANLCAGIPSRYTCEAPGTTPLEAAHTIIES